MRRASFVILGLAIAVLLPACGGGGAGGAGTPTVKWYVFREPSGAFEAAAETCSKAAEGRYRIEIAELPAQADAQREQLVRRLAARDSDIDIVYMDVIWTAEFAEAGWILPWEQTAARQLSAGVLEGPLATATYKDRLWAAPLTSNTQLLWYRKSLVPEAQVPTTWDALIDFAERLPAGQNLVQEQGARYEGLTVWFNSVLASAGGAVVEGAGQEAEVVIGGEATVRGLEILRRFARSAIADPALATNTEDPGRLRFQEGSSAFMLNWPFVYPSAREDAPQIFEDMGWARYPGVDPREPSRPPLGGANLAVGAFSKQADLTRQAIRCLVSPENQASYAIQGGLPPTLARVYDDPAVREEYPFADLLRESINDAAPRPVSPAYNDISRAIYTTIHPLRSINPRQDAEELEEKVSKAVRSEGLL
jgi:multiple sugar transport system substrate-binding protein